MSAAAAFYSRYAPDTEAERYAKTILADKKPSLIFILGAGKNYLGKACRQLSPGARIVLIQAAGGFDGDLVDMPDRTWHPELDIALEELLASSLDDGKAAGGIAVLEWQPVLNAFPEEAHYIRSAMAQALERYSSASATRSYWAKRWLRNSVRFALKAKRFARIHRGAGPLVLACAGPSLEYSLDAFPQKGMAIWALASAQEALERRGYMPSLVLTSDPGHWASLHLRASLSGACPLATPPSAALPSSLLEGAATIVALDTGMAFEAMALEAAGARAHAARSSGTAAGTALSLALAACEGRVYVLGQDFAARGLAAHARPYALDGVDFFHATRLNPDLRQRSFQIYERYGQSMGDWHLSRAFSAYAKDVFLSDSERGRCMRISDSPVESDLPKHEPSRTLPGIIRADTLTAKITGSQSEPRFEEYASPYSRAERADRMAGALERESKALAALIRERSIAVKVPLSAADATSLLAFAGRSAAPFIAEAARNRIEPGSVQSALSGLERGKTALLELCHA